MWQKRLLVVGMDYQKPGRVSATSVCAYYFHVQAHCSHWSEIYDCAYIFQQKLDLLKCENVRVCITFTISCRHGPWCRCRGYVQSKYWGMKVCSPAHFHKIVLISQSGPRGAAPWCEDCVPAGNLHRNGAALHQYPQGYLNFDIKTLMVKKCMCRPFVCF